QVPDLRRLAGDHRVEIDVELPEPAVEGPPRPLEPEQVERERVETPLGHAGEAGGERVEEARVEVRIEERPAAGGGAQGQQAPVGDEVLAEGGGHRGR